MPEFERIYNESYHRSIKCQPVAVNKSNEMEIFDELYKAHYKNRKENQLTLGSSVLRKIDKKLFEKGRAKTFSPDVYHIHTINKTTPITYLLRNQQGVLVNRPYYRRELFAL